jgi:hypothetical protein
MFRTIINRYANPWATWVKDTGDLRHKLVTALRILHPGEGELTFADLETHAQRHEFQRHKPSLKAFYEQAASKGVGSDAHRDWLQAKLEQMTPQRLADVMAYLPEQAPRTQKPKLVPDAIVAAATKAATKAVNAHLHEINAPILADDVLAQLLARMGTQVGHRR